MAVALAAATLVSGLAAPMAGADTGADTDANATGERKTTPAETTTTVMTGMIDGHQITYTQDPKTGSWTGGYTPDGDTDQPARMQTVDVTVTTIIEGQKPQVRQATAILTSGDLKSDRRKLDNGQTVTTWTGTWSGAFGDQSVTLTGTGRRVTGPDRTRLNASLDRAGRALDGTWHAKAGEDKVRQLVGQADRIGDDSTTVQADQLAERIDQAVKTLKPVSFTATIDGNAVGTLDATGRFTPTGTFEGIPESTVTVTPDGKDTGYKPMTLTLKADGTPKAADNTLGVVDVTGRVTGTMDDHEHRPLTVTVDYHSRQGSPQGVDQVSEFHAGRDGVYAGVLQYGLNEHGTPVGEHGRVDQIGTPDGPARLDWSDVTPYTPAGSTVTVMRRTATVSGSVDVNWKGFAGVQGTAVQKWRVDVSAARATDSHVTPSLLQTRADGSTRMIPVTGDTMTLGSDDATSSYAIVFDKGPDAVVSDVRSTPLDHGVGRVFTWTQDGRERSLRLMFDRAALSPDSEARLEGIYVNWSGQSSKGELIDGWDPNRLSYVLSIGEKDPSPYILPVAGDGVSVKATDVRQTADGAAQTWRVTARVNGVSRDYTVTVIRARSWQTAAEKYVPGDPVAVPGTVDAGDSDTVLQSVGYRVDGKYTPVAGGSMTIPEGGVFAWQAKKGQVATVSSVRLHGTTWRYTVGVLAPDGVSYATTTVDATFITEATHRAVLTGLKVDGSDVHGFDPDRLEYDVPVDNPDRWVLAPQYDRTSGMSVDTSKDGGVATVKVTSADGLESRSYTVRVHRSASATVRQTVGRAGALAQTGVGMVAGAVMLVMAALAGLAAWVRRRV